MLKMKEIIGKVLVDERGGRPIFNFVATAEHIAQALTQEGYGKVEPCKECKKRENLIDNVEKVKKRWMEMCNCQRFDGHGISTAKPPCPIHG